MATILSSLTSLKTPTFAPPFLIDRNVAASNKERRCFMCSNHSIKAKAFLLNNVRFRLVPFNGQDVHPITGIAFYVNNGRGGALGLRVYPDGHTCVCNATKNKNGREYSHGKQEYLQFRHPWNTNEMIYASHAVYLAWIGPIKPGLTIDHIDGCTTNNDFRNLRCVSNLINNRDGGFSRKLTNKGFDITRILRPYLLRYFDRMAEVKKSISNRRYCALTRENLFYILYDPEFDLNRLFPRLTRKQEH